MKFSIVDVLKFYINVMENENFLPDVPKRDVLNYMAQNYNFDNTDLESWTALLIMNFMLVYSNIINDLKEITERIECINKDMAGLSSGDYEFKKLNYFRDRNIQAKKEIEKFLIHHMAGYIKERITNREKDTGYLLDLDETSDKLPYSYSYYRRYYDPQYDFSTESKFCFLLEHNREAIDIKIKTKRDSPIRYFEDIDKIVRLEGLLKKIISKVKDHHRLKNRIEIFETLYKLYENESYQSFINLAVIQIEGLFYDLCAMIDDEQETDNMGTLSVKAEKIFESNFVLWLSVYPYFAFEVPIFRNMIAHKGLWDAGNLKNFANELILDLHTILEMIKLPYIPPNNLLILFMLIRQKITHLKFMDSDYETILIEMFTAVQLEKNCSKNIFVLLEERETKRELFEYYIIPISDETNTNLYEECNRLIEVIYDEKFWDIILTYMQKVKTYNPREQHSFVDFVRLITENYIGKFKTNTSIKNKCIKIKKELDSYY